MFFDQLNGGLIAATHCRRGWLARRNLGWTRLASRLRSLFPQLVSFEHSDEFLEWDHGDSLSQAQGAEKGRERRISASR